MPAKIFENINLNDPRTEGEQYLIDIFKTSSRFEGYTVFEQPHINSMKPDFILLHPERGVIIIEVKDWDLESNVYKSGGYILGTDGNLYERNPVKQVEGYKDNILKLELTNTVLLLEGFSDKYYGCIETAVYFHTASEERANAFCNSCYSHTKIWTKKDIDYMANSNNRLSFNKHTYALTLNHSKFNVNGVLTELVRELSLKLQYSDYNYERKAPFILNRAQNSLATLKPKAIRRWSGIAGSGKSLVIAEKAVRALKEGQRVLILTYNITLRSYLRDLCSQQFGPGDEERKSLKKDLSILHFHGLLKTMMAEYGIGFASGCEKDNDEDFTELWMEAIYSHLSNNERMCIFNYDYILIDEGQDFRGSWIQFLKQFFTQKGEIFIVYDKSQDLFQNGLWIEDPEQTKNIGFKGKPGVLKHSYRLPVNIVYKINTIRKYLQIGDEDILVPPERQMSMLNRAFWFNYRDSNIIEKLRHIENHIEQLRKSNNWEDITILTTNENTGVKIVEHFQKKGVKIFHVYDMTCHKNMDRRRYEKWKFQGGFGRLKICSYHSYKGWQSPNILLVLDSPTTKYLNGITITGKNDPESIKNAIFISISRVKGKVETGEYSYTCLNFLPEYNYLSLYFDSSF